MTETPPQEQARPGLATDNLRSYERLRRSVTDRKIAGVAGGLGRHLNVDPTVLRVIFVVLAFFGGAGLVLYVAAWLVVPEEGTERSVVQTSPSTRTAVLIAVAVVAALLLLGDAWGTVGFPWPLALIGLVVLVVLVNRDRDPDSPASLPKEHTPMTHDTAFLDTGAEPTGGGTPPGPGGWYAPPVVPPPAPRPPVDRGPTLFGPTVALLLVALGSLGLYDTANPVVAAAYPALALTVVGAMLLVGSVFGRPGGLILLGIVAVLALAVTSAADGNWNAERLTPTPAIAAQVADSYELGAGQIVLDLTDVEDLENLDGRTVSLDAAAGELLVLVPDGLDVDVRAGIDVGGEIEVGGTVENGNAVELVRSIDGGEDAPELDLELDLVVGHIEVRQEDAS